MVPVTLQVALRGAYDAALFGSGHALGSAAVTIAPAETDFGEDQTVSILHDQVDFSQPALKIACKGPETAGVKVRFRYTFPAFAVGAAVNQ